MSMGGLGLTAGRCFRDQRSGFSVEEVSAEQEGAGEERGVVCSVTQTEASGSLELQLACVLPSRVELPQLHCQQKELLGLVRT